MQKMFCLLVACLLAAFSSLVAQRPAGGGFSQNRPPQNGRFYGKIVDENGKGVGYATVKLLGKTFDRATRTAKDTLFAGQLTEDNGDFSLEKLPVVGDFELAVSFLGYAEVRKTVSFGIKRPERGAEKGPEKGDEKSPEKGQTTGGGGKPGGQQRPVSTDGDGSGGGGWGGSAAAFEKDLGNIRLGAAAASATGEVTVTARQSGTMLAIDRKTFSVEKDLTTAGGTAQDALKNVPSLSVDLDGNVSLRNSAPQIFVDGRPTTLSLDQIPASDIESVEVITNPSARFDAGGGPAGIVNIVLKKEKRLGYNGNVRAGGDSQGGYNANVDLNARGGKINLFGSARFDQNRNRGEQTTLRENLFGSPLSNVGQTNRTRNDGFGGNARAGLDWLIDNRNTLTVSSSLMMRGGPSTDDLTVKTDLFEPNGTVSSSYRRQADNERTFQNLGASAQFKHLFPKKGAEWTADVNFNRIRPASENSFLTTFDNGLVTRERQEGSGRSRLGTAQIDFVNPVGERSKIEGGLKATMRRNRNENTSFIYDSAENDWRRVAQPSDRYRFRDDVFAAYVQGSRQFGAWGAQAGLRAESSFYTGELLDTDSTFSIDYPISLFPSLFLTRKLNDGGDQLQLALTRRINRPNFWQTMPFTDFSDSLNLRRGNVALIPEFTNSVELSYQNIFSKGHNLLASVYYKRAENVISGYQFTEFNAALGREVVVTSYANGSWASAAGAELTLKNTFFGWLELTSNANLFQATVDATNVESQLELSRFSAFLKENLQIRLPKKFSVQLNGEWRSRASFAPASAGGGDFRPGGGGGGMHGGGSQNSAQGYTKAIWFVDASVKKDFWKNAASLTLSMQDVFASRRQGSVTETSFFTQETSRLMNPQLVRLNFSYRFGKVDASLFNRKNTRQNAQGADMMQ